MKTFLDPSQIQYPLPEDSSDVWVKIDGQLYLAQEVEDSVSIDPSTQAKVRERPLDEVLSDNDVKVV